MQSTIMQNLSVIPKILRQPTTAQHYGTAGYRGPAETLESTVGRAGLAACIEAAACGRFIGVMLTASHNHYRDNGVKIIDASGMYMDAQFERSCDELVNCPDSAFLDLFLKRAQSVVDKLCDAKILIGRDTRESGCRLERVLLQALSYVGVRGCSVGFVTTPQLHWLVRASNNDHGCLVSPSAYISHLVEGYERLVKLWKNEEQPVSVDTAHGVGALIVNSLISRLPSKSIRIINTPGRISYNQEKFEEFSRTNTAHGIHSDLPNKRESSAKTDSAKFFKTNSVEYQLTDENHRLRSNEKNTQINSVEYQLTDENHRLRSTEKNTQINSVEYQLKDENHRIRTGEKNTQINSEQYQLTDENHRLRSTEKNTQLNSRDSEQYQLTDENHRIRTGEKNAYSHNSKNLEENSNQLVKKKEDKDSYVNEKEDLLDCTKQRENARNSSIEDTGFINTKNNPNASINNTDKRACVDHGGSGNISPSMATRPHPTSLSRSSLSRSSSNQVSQREDPPSESQPGDDSCGKSQHVAQSASQLDNRRESTGLRPKSRPSFFPDPYLLNEKCGADYVVTNRKPPAYLCPDAGPLRRVAAFDGDADRLVYFAADPEFTLIDGDRLAVGIANFIHVLTRNIGTFSVGMVLSHYSNSAALKSVSPEIKTVLAETGVKHFVEAASMFDIGIFFEPNGHGSVAFSKDCISKLEKITLTADLPKETIQKADILLALANLFDPCVGDAIANFLIIEAIMDNSAWRSLAERYRNLPTRMLTVRVKDKNTIKTIRDIEIITPVDLRNRLEQLCKAHRGRAFVRPSGTEDVVRIFAESHTTEDADSLCVRVAQAVYDLCDGTGNHPEINY